MLTSAFSIGQPNSHVLLYEGRAELVFPSTRASCDARFILDLANNCSIHIDAMKLPDEVFPFFLNEEVKSVKFPSGVAKGNFIVACINRHGGDTKARLLPSGVFVIHTEPNHGQISHLDFHLINLPDFYSRRAGENLTIPSNGGFRTFGRVQIEFDEFLIEVQAHDHTKSIIETLKSDGGFGVTHLGQLSRKDGAEFTFEIAERLIGHIRLFFSFARGHWVQLTPATGYNKDGEVIYWNFSSQLCTPWEGRLSWFDSHHANTLADVFPGFLRLLEDPHYGKAVSTSLYWYLRSNRAGAGAGPDGGLILSQAALERLSVTILRKNKCDVPKKAAKIIRAACKTLNIPTALPTNCSDIYVHANQYDWDSPRVIAEVRNSLVHPDDNENISNIKNPYFESWNLAQYYIELFVLNLSRFNGSYKNRLTAKWRGEVEKTPWT